jgi:diadenosine tetraphosphate (Ap4A) HIT family hydrolase
MVRRGDCDAFNIGINMGAAAGQTVMYPHVHLIPRRTGDVADPVGGVRATIPGQANYKKPGYKNPTDK